MNQGNIPSMVFYGGGGYGSYQKGTIHFVEYPIFILELLQKVNQISPEILQTIHLNKIFNLN